jgi:hypothetical protein
VMMPTRTFGKTGVKILFSNKVPRLDC